MHTQAFLRFTHNFTLHLCFRLLNITKMVTYVEYILHLKTAIRVSKEISTIRKEQFTHIAKKRTQTRNFQRVRLFVFQTDHKISLALRLSRTNLIIRIQATYDTISTTFCDRLIMTFCHSNYFNTGVKPHPDFRI